MLEKGQVPESIKKFQPTEVYITEWNGDWAKQFKNFFLHDTIINFEGLMDSLRKKSYHINSYRLVYKNHLGEIDSLKELDEKLSMPLLKQELAPSTSLVVPRKHLKKPKSSFKRLTLM